MPYSKWAHHQTLRYQTSSSPGPDGVPYYIWKYTKSSSQALSAIFIICYTNQRIPANYHFNAATLDQSWVIKVDAKIRRLAKRALRLPARTASAFFHTAKYHGGLRLHSLEDNLCRYPLPKLSLQSRQNTPRHCLVSTPATPLL